MVDLHFFMNCRKYRYCLIHAKVTWFIYLLLKHQVGTYNFCSSWVALDFVFYQDFLVYVGYKSWKMNMTESFCWRCLCFPCSCLS